MKPISYNENGFDSPMYCIHAFCIVASAASEDAAPEENLPSESVQGFFH